MNRRSWTKLGIVELGALAVLWRASQVAPLVTAERDLHDDLDDLDDVDLDVTRPTRRSRRAVDCGRQHHLAG